MNIFFDVDYTLINMYGGLRPWVREVFHQLRLDGHVIYVWSGVGVRWPVVRQHHLEAYVADCFQKPLDDHHRRLKPLGIDLVPDFCIDDYQEIIDAFGGTVVRPYFWNDALDLEMHRVYARISSHVVTAGAPQRGAPTH